MVNLLHDLKRQSAYFADVFMTRHLLDVMLKSGIRLTLSLPAALQETTRVETVRVK